jgi:hypothetical protein
LLRGRSRNPYATTNAELLAVFWSPLGEDYLFDPISSQAALGDPAPVPSSK